MSASEAACTYAALILQDDGIPIIAEKIRTLVKAAGVNVESYWPGLFAKLRESERWNLEDLIMNAGAAGGAVAATAALFASGGAPAAAAPVAEEKKEEPVVESADDMGFSLFD